MLNTTSPQPSSLSRTTKILHSLIGIGMIGMLAAGLYMTSFEAYGVYDWHKSFGVLILILALFRIAWRIKKGWPTPVSDESPALLLVAKLVHWALIITTALYPISGIMMSVGGGHGLGFFGLELVAESINAQGETVALNSTIGGIGHSIHGWIVYPVIAIIVLHAAGALKHHVIDKDNTLKRMFS